jgi:predicted GIY-YIG superfamily endonuclease
MFKNFVYIIKGINNNKTKYYIGYTNNLFRRIKQHNRLLKGGAKATKGYIWSYFCIFTNFSNNIEALQTEWRIKYSTYKKNIIDKINSFINYINTNKRVSPNGNNLNKKLLIYSNINIIKSNYLINVNVDISYFLLEHLMN